MAVVGTLLLSGVLLDRAVAQDARAAASATPATAIVPHESWSCGLPGGIPRPESGTLVFEATMTLERVVDVGMTPYGRRHVAVVQEGVLSGARLSGSVMTGALDFALTLANGVVEIEQSTC